MRGTSCFNENKIHIQPFFHLLLQIPPDGINNTTDISFTPFIGSFDFTIQQDLAHQVSTRTSRTACTESYTASIVIPSIASPPAPSQPNIRYITFRWLNFLSARSVATKKMPSNCFSSVPVKYLSGKLASLISCDLQFRWVILSKPVPLLTLKTSSMSPNHTSQLTWSYWSHLATSGELKLA